MILQSLVAGLTVLRSEILASCVSLNRSSESATPVSKSMIYHISCMMSHDNPYESRRAASYISHPKYCEDSEHQPLDEEHHVRYRVVEVAYYLNRVDDD